MADAEKMRAHGRGEGKESWDKKTGKFIMLSKSDGGYRKIPEGERVKGGKTAVKRR